MKTAVEYLEEAIKQVSDGYGHYNCLLSVRA